MYCRCAEKIKGDGFLCVSREKKDLLVGCYPCKERKNSGVGYCSHARESK